MSNRTRGLCEALITEPIEALSSYLAATRMPLMCLWHWKHVSVSDT
jgi:hypothetical protein